MEITGVIDALDGIYRAARGAGWYSQGCALCWIVAGPTGLRFVLVFCSTGLRPVLDCCRPYRPFYQDALVRVVTLCRTWCWMVFTGLRPVLDCCRPYRPSFCFGILFHRAAPCAGLLSALQAFLSGCIRFCGDVVSHAVLDGIHRAAPCAGLLPALQAYVLFWYSVPQGCALCWIVAGPTGLRFVLVFCSTGLRPVLDCCRPYRPSFCVGYSVP